MGRPLSDMQIHLFAGGMHNTLIETIKHGQSLHIVFDHPTMFEEKGLLTIGPDFRGNLSITLVNLRLSQEVRGQGLGARIFANQALVAMEFHQQFPEYSNPLFKNSG